MSLTFDPDITIYFSGASNDGTNLTIPNASLEGVNSASNGADIRHVLYAILEGFADQYIGVTVSGVPLTVATDRSENISCTRVSSVPNDYQIRKTYTISVNLALGDMSPSFTGDE